MIINAMLGFSFYKTLSIIWISGIFSRISIGYHWTTKNPMSGALRRALRQINMWLVTCHDLECTWEPHWKLIFFRMYWHWLLCQQLDLSSMSLPWIHFSPICVLQNYLTKKDIVWVCTAYIFVSCFFVHDYLYLV